MSFCGGFEKSAMNKTAIRLPTAALAGMLAVSPAAGAEHSAKPSETTPTVAKSQKVTTNSLREMAHAKAKKYKIDPHVFRGLVQTESSYRHKIINREGRKNPERWSVGLAQVQPRTARDMGFKGHHSELTNPDTNLEYGAKYLRRQLKRYKGDYRKALSAYNAGTATKANKKYVTKVLTHARKLKRGR